MQASGRKDGQMETDTSKLTAAFHNFANAPNTQGTQVLKISYCEIRAVVVHSQRSDEACLQ
jgi:hypothetical protein